MSEPKPKSFEISKRAVWEAYRRVKANKGAAGVDEQSIAEFERDLQGNLYKLWNRLSSGSYFPPPVRAVEIPKRDGSSRMLGVPTVADRIAQTVVRSYLEPEVEPVFHPDSYGYRPGRSALDAVGVCRERCWRNDWVIDMDIRTFFDSVPWDLMLKAVAHHTDLRWVLLYVERWLKAPLQTGGRQPGRAGSRDPAGFGDLALAGQHVHALRVRRVDGPGVPGASRSSATAMTSSSTPEASARPAVCGPRSPRGWRSAGWSSTSTRPASCTARTTTGAARTSTTSFDFLGYTFRPRLSKSRFGKHFVNFSPAVSGEAKTRMRREMRRWRLHLRRDKTLTDLARMFNVVVQGWINYYGRFYKSMLYPVFRHLNEILVRWAMRKYKRLRRHPRPSAQVAR